MLPIQVKKVNYVYLTGKKRRGNVNPVQDMAVCFEKPAVCTSPLTNRCWK